MKDDPCDGCGISKIWLTSPDDVFSEACSWHDYAYTVGSPWQTKHTRKQVDDMFLGLMLASVVLHKGGIVMKAKAYFYYSLARMFGAKYWEGKQ